MDRVAVTKAITSVDPDHPELVAARALGIQPESVAAGHRRRGRDPRATLVAVTGTHGKSTTSGWLLDILVGAGADPSGFVGALLPAAIAGPQRGVARIGAGATSSSRRTSTPATSTRTARTSWS